MKTIKSILFICIIALSVAFTTNNKEGYKIGDKIEDFSLKNINNEMVSLSNYKNAKGFVIVFTCNHCPYAIANEDRLIALDKKYKELGFPVIAINPNDPIAAPDDNFENMIIRSEEKGFTFPYLIDEGQKVYPKFGATKTPHVFIVTANDMKVQYIGAIDNSSRDESKATEKYVENAIDALLAGKSIKKTETRAIGCSIKVQ